MCIRDRRLAIKKIMQHCFKGKEPRGGWGGAHITWVEYVDSFLKLELARIKANAVVKALTELAEKVEEGWKPCDVDECRIRQVFPFEGRKFQSLNKFCNTASPLLTSQKSPGRFKLYGTRFQGKDTLWVDCEAHRLANVWVPFDCKDNPKFKLDIGIPGKRCTEYKRRTVLYAVDAMEEVSGSKGCVIARPEEAMENA